MVVIVTDMQGRI